MVLNFFLLVLFQRGDGGYTSIIMSERRHLAHSFGVGLGEGGVSDGMSISLECSNYSSLLSS